MDELRLAFVVIGIVMLPYAVITGIAAKDLIRQQRRQRREDWIDRVEKKVDRRFREIERNCKR